MTVEFSSFKESVRSFLLMSRVSDPFYESQHAKTTSVTPLFLLNSRYGGRTKEVYVLTCTNHKIAFFIVSAEQSGQSRAPNEENNK
ncbi:hypothetical protein TSAR_013431 [Trichomalopsis sarcophagae]|uniref:Uncharacterized protein n=1 Tax=Trichomalopsis sarcophagae TaxID=543379 RepID=A0A232ETS1_9HYME|nr:hypothetical protein TSAR_013431 [Trichomalopsis sarcophagae]